jgi:benzoyl-CoA reductase/2-hydroxyglutaryl-CoA dehydratase subunit BcrC/BadD/HgdB
MDPELLELLGLTGEDARRESPRMEKAFQILGIGAEDISRAKERIRGFYDLELLGVRKALGVWVLELVDMVLAKEEGKKVVYASFPPMMQLVGAMALAGEDIYYQVPEIVLCITLNCLFKKINPVLEVAEKRGMAPGLAYCSFLKARFGAISAGIIARPDLLVPSGLMCDKASKTDELLHEIQGTPVAYVDNIFDGKGEQWAEVVSPRLVKYLASAMKDAARKFEEVFGYPLTEAKIRQAAQEAAKLAEALRGVQELMLADPMPLSVRDYSIIQRIAFIRTRRALKDGTAALNTLKEDLQKRVRMGRGVLKRGAPRLVASVLPFNPEICGMFEELGLAIPIPILVGLQSRKSEGSFPSIWEAMADFSARMRGAYYSSLAYNLQAKELVQEVSADGFLVFRHIGCRQEHIWSPKTKDLVERELGVPVMLLDGDYCDFRDYNMPQMRTRVETFAQIVRDAKQAKGTP